MAVDVAVVVVVVVVVQVFSLTRKFSSLTCCLRDDDDDDDDNDKDDAEAYVTTTCGCCNANTSSEKRFHDIFVDGLVGDCCARIINIAKSQDTRAEIILWFIGVQICDIGYSWRL